MSGLSAYKKMNKNDLTAECAGRGIDINGKNREGLIHALQEFDIQANQNLEGTGPERGSATPEPSGSEAASPDRPAETDTGIPRIVIPKPPHEQANTPLLATSMDSPQMQETLQRLRETDPVVYLQFLERQAEREERRAEREAAHREADRRHELEMTRLQQQRQVQNPGSLEHRDAALPVAPAAKFPVMEKDSDIDVYLLSFEKTCRQYHLPPAQWARYLTPGLRGKALDAYVELSEEQGNDYEALKAAIIQKFQLTPEVYRKRFRSLQKGPGDSYLDVESRLRTTFRQWTKGLKADSFESLEDLMIEDQLLHICPTDVRQFVLERKPTSAKVAAELADTYIHSRVSDHRKAPPNGWKGGKSHMATPPPPANQVPQQMEPAVPGAKAFLTNNRTCYTCGKAGHLKAQCPEQKKLTSPGHPASNPSAVLFVSGKPPGTNANLQPVTVGHRTVIGLRDTGAEVTLVRPEVIEETDIIPEKFLTLTGVGGTLSCVPRAYVFIDWGAGSGMREVGVSEEIPTAVLLGADLGTLVSYYVPAKSTQDAPTELSGPTKVLCTDVGVISGQPVDGQREGEGEVEVQGPPYSETGEETPLLGKVTDTGSNDAAMINVKCDDADVDVDDNALPVLVVTRSAAKAAEVQALIAEQQEEVSGPSPCSDPADSTSVEPHQPSLFATGLLAGTCGTAFETALQTDQTLAQLRSSADRPPAENCKQKVYWEKGKLYTEGLPAEGNETDTRSRQLVVPSQFRGQLLTDSREVDSELLINSKLTPTQVPGLKRVLAVHGSRFTGKPGRTHLAIHQVDTGTHPPIKQSAYRVSLEVLADMKREVEEMLQLGVIQKSHSAWASPVVLVPKKDRTTRFCVDYRKLNAITTADAYPMPRIDELLDRLAAAHYITIMDLSRGYWQIPLAPEAREKSAFITPFGLFEFTVMPFGMKNAPATFQRVMNDLLEGLEPFAVAYLDDIAVFSPTWEEHLMHLSQVLDRLTDANLTVKPSKCQIGMNDVHYLGHQVGGGTLKPQTGKVEAILAWPIPQTKKQVMSFLGTAGYYRKFVGNYSSLAKPLTDLTKKKLPKVVSWTPECEQAFQALKEALASAPVLQAPDFTRRFLVQTDASAYGLGAVLSQVDDAGEEHPILYLSRKLLPREVAYATIEKECLAIVWSLQKLQTYLYGRHFTVITDHNPLSWLNRVAGENGKLLWWSLILQQYDFTIQHKKGSAHGNADGLSRQAEPAGVGCVRREIVVPSHATT
ncbi:uncharacterized protein LOC120935519 [Rana temporaria]|uniref:uncharacterized protein LOC120935519 n=1 Tax=Rana temporaria TaxID=8407 RepID=UPI001AAD9ACF|nr:uncharacterized protein LOC120935519 [Rana temporaria]